MFKGTATHSTPMAITNGPMTTHSQRAKTVTPKYEDAGLFRDEICQLSVTLIPVIRRNSRDDFLVTGFVNEKLEIDVLFAGRRKVEAAPLMTHLRALRKHQLEVAAKHGAPPPLVTDMRLSVHIEGAWRRIFQTEPDGWETHTYQLVAARWGLVNRDGQKVSYGTPPVK